MHPNPWAETSSAVCLAPGSEVLVPDPGWPNYGLSASVLGAELVHYPCPADNAWLPDVAAMEAAVTDSTRMIVICNPSNPTGALIPDAILRDILNLAAARGLYVLADEIYCDITYTDEPPPSTLSIAEELGVADHVLTLGGASKSFAMTGFRVGWLRASEEIITQATKCQEAFVSCGVPFAQAGAIAALEGDQSRPSPCEQHVAPPRRFTPRRCCTLLQQALLGLVLRRVLLQLVAGPRVSSTRTCSPSIYSSPHRCATLPHAEARRRSRAYRGAGAIHTQRS